MQRIPRRAGLHYVCVGNVYAETDRSTYCPGCGIKVLGGDWCMLSDWHHDARGHCTECGLTVAGMFGVPPWPWGAKHQPVRLQ